MSFYPLLHSLILSSYRHNTFLLAHPAPCVCRHWREVCWGLQQPQQWGNLPTDAAEKAVWDAWAAARAAGRALLPSAAAGSAAPEAAAVASGSSVVVYDDGDGYGTVGSPVRLPEGLWGCLDVRCRPSARLDDTVIARGLASGCWSQVCMGVWGAGGGMTRGSVGPLVF